MSYDIWIKFIHKEINNIKEHMFELDSGLKELSKELASKSKAHK